MIAAESLKTSTKTLKGWHDYSRIIKNIHQNPEGVAYYFFDQTCNGIICHPFGVTLHVTMLFFYSNSIPSGLWFSNQLQFA
jgi:hypothetical protein